MIHKILNQREDGYFIYMENDSFKQVRWFKTLEEFNLYAASFENTSLKSNKKLSLEEIKEITNLFQYIYKISEDKSIKFVEKIELNILRMIIVENLVITDELEELFEMTEFVSNDETINILRKIKQLIN